MIVAAHHDVDGAVTDYCRRHGLEIGERYDGKLVEYRGRCRVVVSGEPCEKYEFYRIKLILLRSRVNVVSLEWASTELDEFVEYLNLHRRSRSGGRCPYGFRRVGGELVEDAEKMAVVKRIVGMRIAGAKYREIAAETGLSISTIQVILANRVRYGV